MQRPSRLDGLVVVGFTRSMSEQRAPHQRTIQAVCKRINEAVAYLQKDDAEAALTPLLNAIDAIAGRGRSDYKAWLSKRMNIISLCFFSLGAHSFSNVNIPYLPLSNSMKKPDEHGTVPLQEVIYHLIRCGLVHDCSLPKQIQDNKTAAYQYDHKTGTMYLSYQNLATGLLMALLMDIPQGQSALIQGDVRGYPLAHLCNLPDAEMLAMLRSFWPAKSEYPSPSVVFLKDSPSPEGD